ncbi:MAG: DUF2950 family protein [Acidobacteriaceae bacterium]|nr:DUF2950 family protein [Acidobacteriaceae bacterium]
MFRAHRIMIQKMMAMLPLVLLACTLACMPPQAKHAAVSTPAAPSIQQPKAPRFSTPADAAAALYDASRSSDQSNLVMVLGPGAAEIVAWSPDTNERQQEQSQFVQKYEQMHRLVTEPDDTVALYVGAENWPLPIPLVHDDGGWYFDTDLGGQEIRYRRVGNNEMEALGVCHTLVDAEWDYQGTEHRFTAKFVSDGDSRDGLYWSNPNNNDATKSPIGPYLALAGVSSVGSPRSQPFHGYYYRILLRSSDGFVILAFPAEYRSSGVMTFLVKADGTAYEKDFGNQADAASTDIASTQPDNSWTMME